MLNGAVNINNDDHNNTDKCTVLSGLVRYYCGGRLHAYKPRSLEIQKQYISHVS